MHFNTSKLFKLFVRTAYTELVRLKTQKKKKKLFDCKFFDCCKPNGDKFFSYDKKYGVLEKGDISTRVIFWIIYL